MYSAFLCVAALLELLLATVWVRIKIRDGAKRKTVSLLLAVVSVSYDGKQKGRNQVCDAQ